MYNQRMLKNPMQTKVLQRLLMSKLKLSPPLMVIPIIAASALSGCGWLMGDEGYFRDRKHDYREAEVSQPINVPDNLDKSAIKDLYPVPGWQGAQAFSNDFEVPMPEAFVTKSQGEIRAFKSGNRYWISVNTQPASAWAKVRRFWELNSIELALEEPFKGDMETVWLSREKENIATRDKFRIRVEHGMHENSAEVYIMHLGFPATAVLPAAEQLDWSVVKEEDELAVAIMQELASFLIDTEYEGAPASLLAQSFSGAPKSSLSTDASGRKILVLQLNYERAWEAVGKAIEDAEIEVADKDRSPGNYYVNYYPNAEEKKEGGFFSFLPFVGNDGSKGKAFKFVVNLKTESEKIVVAVASDDEKIEKDLSEAVLATIRENLI